MHTYRTHTCGELRPAHISEKARLSGWIHHRRDHGGVLFIDLRDMYGITQVVFHPTHQELMDAAAHLHLESVITVTGTIVARDDETVNKSLPTGEVELHVEEMIVESKAENVPFQVAESRIVNEELRLKYRFIDLRREEMKQNILFRAEVIATIRAYMEAQGFSEITTPILANSSPEGARDYLVPSRLHHGCFYALPQAPQQYKQLLMISGFDKYYQIAPCFRDEDARADRSPGEFYQLDLEMAYATQEDVFALIDGLMTHVVQKHAKQELLSENFPRIPYTEAMNTYGTDKPDIRFDLPLVDITEELSGSECQIFAQARKPGMALKALRYPGGTGAPRSFYDGIQDWAKQHGLKGLAYLVYEEDGEKGPIVKFLTEEEKTTIRTLTKAEKGDVVFFAAAPWKIACKALGALRIVLADRMELRDPHVLAFCWVVDFPMYERDEHSGEIVFSHNPFSMPQGGMEDLCEKDPLDILAYQYDICCNGVELSSGAIRNHQVDVMYKAFEIGGYTKEEVDKNFGHMIRAFSYGAPPHGGIAPGIDRLVMLLAGEDSIREVIAFPKNQKAQDLLVGAPSPVFPSQLTELGIRCTQK